MDPQINSNRATCHRSRRNVGPWILSGKPESHDPTLRLPRPPPLKAVSPSGRIISAVSACAVRLAAIPYPLRACCHLPANPPSAPPIMGAVGSPCGVARAGPSATPPALPLRRGYRLRPSRAPSPQREWAPKNNNRRPVGSRFRQAESVFRLGGSKVGR